MIHHTSTDAQLRRRRLLLQTGKTQAYGSHPLGERDDRLGNGISIPRILMQPTFQTLTRGITQMLHDLLGRHISGEIQLHGTTTLLLTEHRILSFNLQENVRSPLSDWNGYNNSNLAQTGVAVQGLIEVAIILLLLSIGLIASRKLRRNNDSEDEGPYSNAPELNDGTSRIM